MGTTSLSTYANFTATTIAGGAGGVGSSLASTDTTLTLASGAGAAFPATGPFMCLIGTTTAGQGELIQVGTRAGDVLSGIIRGSSLPAPDTCATQSWPVGTAIQQVASAGSLTDITSRLSHLAFNVKDPNFGATADGTTDDTAAIQAAINAAQNAGGGVVYFPAGTYLLSSTLSITADNVQLVGSGYGTVLIPSASFGTNYLITAQASGASGQFRSGFAVRDLILRGNDQAGVSGIHLISTYHALIDNLQILHVPGTGIYCDGIASAYGAYTTIRATTISNGGAGRGIDTGHHEWGIVQGGLIAWYNSAGGIGIRLADSNWRLFGVGFDECDTGVLVTFAQQNALVGCQFDRGVTTYINLQGASQTVIDGCSFAGFVGTGAQAIISVNNSANANNVITGNIATPGTGWTYFVQEVAGTGHGNLYRNNTFHGFGVALVSGKMLFDVGAFGAQADGTTDDTAAIQAAINAAQNAGGGAVYIPAGTYKITAALTISKSAVTIYGDGWGGGTSEGAGGGTALGTILSLAGGVNDYLFKFTPSANVRMDGVTIRDLMLNCNGANQTTGGGGIYAFGAAFCHFERLWITAPYNDGIRLAQDNLGGYGHHNVIDGCWFEGGDSVGTGGAGRGVLLGDSSSAGSDENNVHACVFQQMGMGGANTNAALVDNSGLQLIRGCVFVGGSKTAPGIRINAGEGTTVSDCTFDGGNASQVDWGGYNGRIEGCQFYIVGSGAACITASAQNNLIVGNTFVSNSTNTTSGCAIDFEYASGINWAFDNAIITQGTWSNGSPIKSPGKGIIKNCAGYNPAGVQGPPAIPTSGTAYTNPYGSDCNVYVTGGTVSAVAVEGTTTGLTSGLFRVPANATVTLTYSAAPTWVWIAD